MKLKNILKKRIDEEDLKEIKKRSELRDQHILIIQALDGELRGFLNSKMTKYGLDGGKNWNFDIKEGIIKEVKPQTQQMPPQQAPPQPASQPQQSKPKKK